MNKHFTLLKFKNWFTIFLLVIASCKDLSTIKKSTNLKNKIITARNKNLDLSIYGPIFEEFILEFKLSYAFFYEGKDGTFKDWYEENARKLIEENYHLPTGLDSKGKPKTVGGFESLINLGGLLNQENWRKAVDILKEMTKNLKDQHFEILKLFGQEITVKNYHGIEEANAPDRLKLAIKRDELVFDYFTKSNPAFRELRNAQVRDVEEEINGEKEEATYFYGTFPSDVHYLHFSEVLPRGGLTDENILRFFLENLIGNQKKKLILDLRSNEGGVDAGKDLLLSLFFDKEKIYTCIYERGHAMHQRKKPIAGEPKTYWFRNPNKWKVYDKTNPDLLDTKVSKDTLIVILVDQNSVSNAEAITKALRERKDEKGDSTVIVVGEQTRGAFASYYKDPKNNSENGFGGVISIKSPYNKNQEILRWMGGSTPIRSLRGEKEGEGLRPDIEVKFLEKARGVEFREAIFEIGGKKHVERAQFDPQLEKARELLNLPDKEFKRKANSFYKPNTICPEGL